MVGAAVFDQAGVEVIFRAALEVTKELGVWSDAAIGQRCVDALAIREEQRVADIKKYGFDLRVHVWQRI